MGSAVTVGELAIGEPGAVYLMRSEIHDRGEPKELLHVISRAAGGESRGYWRHKDAGGGWRVRRPNYTGDWPEMDRAVADLVGDEINGAHPSAQRSLFPRQGDAR